SVVPLTESKEGPVHSARSVEGGPSTESNIINLSIKPLIREQGFTAIKGRNLGFVQDPTLNAIPVGINNELSNVDVRSTTPQNTVLRDSYGNPVTPFTDLGNREFESVGFRTTVNRDSGSNVGAAGQFNFKVPSYASGIIGPIGQPQSGLLPPSPRVQLQQQPSSTTTVVPVDTTQQFLPNAKIPTIEEGKILFAQKPVDGLLPPLFPGQLPPVYDLNIGTERSPIFVRDPFGGTKAPPTTSTSTLGYGANTTSHIGFKTDVNKQTGFPQRVPITDNRISGSFGLTAQPLQQQNQQASIIQPTSEGTGNAVKTPTVQKYTGGFGGPAGLLGNQLQIGTAYTSTVKPSLPAAPPVLASSIFVPQNSFPSSTTTRPLDQTTPQKYSGNFGGGAGFLGSQQNLGTAYTKQPLNIQQAPRASILTPPAAATPVPLSQSGSAVYGQQQQQLSTQATTTGSIGSVSINQGQTNSSARPAGPSPTFFQQPIRPVSSASFNGGNKFTGSFGGATGLLGSQQQPGTHVKPDGSILSPSAPGVGTHSLHAPSYQQQPQQPLLSLKPTGTGYKFAGSFGGPPGLLRPFDNTNG
uniref:Uncharacterized protein n=1 Tax=Anopheles atroparvus TaxID=41427 RepID=A0AAG5DQZ4_ANOAO